MDNTIAVIDFLKSAETQTILNGLDSEGTPWLSHVFSIYQNYFGETCTTCPSKIMGYIEKIKHLNTETMSTVEEKKYILKQGAVIRVHGGVAYSNANLTDEVAEKLLKENPNRSALFAKLPKETKQAEVIEKQLSKMNKAELLAKAAELNVPEEETNGKSNPDLVKIIETKQAEVNQ